MKGLFTLRSLCVVLILAIQVACNAPEKSAQHYYQQGKALLEQGYIELAQIQFRNALQIEPKLSDAYYQIALIDEKKQNITGMYNNARGPTLPALQFECSSIQFQMDDGLLHFIQELMYQTYTQCIFIYHEMINISWYIPRFCFLKFTAHVGVAGSAD